MNKILKCKQILVFLLIAGYSGCHKHIRINSDPMNDWYEKILLIMTQEEKKNFKSLRGKEQKEAFFEEFWRIRDPLPQTEENENKIEFQNRILYANKWFDRHRRMRSDYSARSARGWLTDKGRIFVIFGPPDKVNYGDGWSIMKEFPPQEAIYESWYYSFFDLNVSFSREKIESNTESNPFPVNQTGEPDSPILGVSRITGTGGWRLMPSFKIIEAVEEAKLDMISLPYRNDYKNRMRFKMKFVGDRLRINIPASQLRYVDEGGNLHVHLLVETQVYRGEYKEFESKKKRILAFSEKEVLELQNVAIEVPYKPTQKGKYVFDVTVTDLKSEYLSKYRKLIKKTF